MRVYLFGFLRHLSYDRDWIWAFLEHYGDVTCHRYDGGRPKGVEAADLIVLLHSATAQHVHTPRWLADLDRAGKLLILTGNDYKFFDEKQALIDALDPDLVGTLCPNAPYRARHVEHIPHALNPAFFAPGPPCARRPVRVGFRGYRYPPGLDGERNRLVEAFEGRDGCDVLWQTFRDPNDYATWLRTCKATPATEAGMTGRKAVSSRHFDAIGSRTALLMYGGEYSGCLTPAHYVEIARDHSNLDDVLKFLDDADAVDRLTATALEHVLKHHTYAHRMRTLDGMLWH